MKEITKVNYQSIKNDMEEHGNEDGLFMDSTGRNVYVAREQGTIITHFKLN